MIFSHITIIFESFTAIVFSRKSNKLGGIRKISLNNDGHISAAKLNNFKLLVEV